MTRPAHELAQQVAKDARDRYAARILDERDALARRVVALEDALREIAGRRCETGWGDWNMTNAPPCTCRTCSARRVLAGDGADQADEPCPDCGGVGECAPQCGQPDRSERGADQAGTA